MAQKPIYTGLYDNEFYDETDMFLYIGDVWIDDIVYLGYNIDQQKTPIYGYASQLFDATAAGHVLVTGSFAINFKESGYLWAILRRYFKMGYKEGDMLNKKNAQALVRGLNLDSDDHARPIVGSNGTNVSRATIERIVQGDVTKKELYDFYDDMSAYSTYRTNSPKDRVFEDIAEAFEDQIWDPAKTTEDLLKQTRRADSNVFDNFDIYVTFGNYSVKTANHTCQQIIGVRLIGSSKTIQIDGGNVIETYNFIARSLI